MDGSGYCYYTKVTDPNGESVWEDPRHNDGLPSVDEADETQLRQLLDIAIAGNDAETVGNILYRDHENGLAVLNSRNKGGYTPAMVAG